MYACTEKKEVHKEPIHDQKQLPFQLPNLPKSMNFAGKEIYLEDMDIQERLDREVLTNVYLQSATSQIIKRAHRWFPVIEKMG